MRSCEGGRNLHAFVTENDKLKGGRLGGPGGVQHVTPLHSLAVTRAGRNDIAILYFIDRGTLSERMSGLFCTPPTWRARQLGERLSAADPPTTAEIANLLSTCDARPATQYASALLRHTEDITLLTKVLARGAPLPLNARLAMAHALLKTRTNSVDLLSLLLHVGEPEQSLCERELLALIRTLPLPEWSDQSATREALLLLEQTLHSLPPPSSDQFPTTDAVPPPTSTAHHLHRHAPRPTPPLLNEQPLPPMVTARLVAAASHHPIPPLASPDHAVATPPTTLDGYVAHVCAGPSQLCLLCAASELTTTGSHSACHRIDACGIAVACARAHQCPALRRTDHHIHSAASSSLAALSVAGAAAASSAGWTLLTSSLVLLADRLFEADAHSSDDGSVESIQLRVAALMAALTAGRHKSAVAAAVSPPASLAPFRLPRCAVQQARAAGKTTDGANTLHGVGADGTPTGDEETLAHDEALRLGRLGRRQWESGAHAVLDTLVRGAIRCGGVGLQQRAIDALGAAASASDDCAGLLSSFTLVLLRRHLRPPPPRPATSARRAIPAADASNEEHAALIAGVCAALPAALRVTVLGECVPLMTSPQPNGSAHLAQAIPILDQRLGRLRALVPAGEEAAVLDFAIRDVLTPTKGEMHGTGGCGTVGNGTCGATSKQTLSAALDVAAWLHLRARGGFSYIDWLASALERSSSRMPTLLNVLGGRITSGWEIPNLVRLQCAAAARAASTDPWSPALSLSTAGCDAAACGALLAVAAAAGIDLPYELCALLPPAHEATTPLLLEGGPRYTPLSRGSGGPLSCGLELLMEQQRRGRAALRAAVRSMTSAPSGEGVWADFVRRVLPTQMHAMMRDATDGCASAAEAPHARSTRRQIAHLLACCIGWGVPEAGRLQQFVEPLPEALRLGAGHVQSALELEAAIRSYLHGAHVHRGEVEGHGAASTALVNVDVGDGVGGASGVGGVGGVGGGLMPDVSALATALLHRACADDDPTARDMARRILVEYAVWLPLDSLERAAQRMMSDATESAPPSASTAAVRAVLLILSLPTRGKEELYTEEADWPSVFDEAFVERVHLAAACHPAAYDPPIAFALVEALLGQLPSLAGCVALRGRMRWLLTRPAVGEEAVKRQRLWRQIARDSGDAEWHAAVPASEGAEGARHGEESSTPSAPILSPQPALCDWVRWEMRSSADAALHAPTLESYCREFIHTHALTAAGGDAATLAESLFTTVVLLQASPASRALADGGTAARARLLRVCAELGEAAGEDSADGGEATLHHVEGTFHRSRMAVDAESVALEEIMHTGTAGEGGGAWWLVRAMLQLVAAAPAVEVDQPAHALAEATLMCVNELSWEPLAPPPPVDGGAAATTAAMHARLLCAPLVHSYPPLLAEYLVALARRHHQPAHAATLDAPSIVRRAVLAAPALSTALRRCTHPSGRVRALPHLRPVIDELLRAAGGEDATPATVGGPRKRKHPELVAGGPPCGSGRPRHGPRDVLEVRLENSSE